MPQGVKEHDYYFAVALLDQSYWVLGSVIGSLLGAALGFDTTGVDFAMTALFLVIAVGQWRTAGSHLPALLGGAATLVSPVSYTHLSARGECPGTIAFAPMGEGGFGYDPVFFVPTLKKTFAQLTAEEKNAISHRGKALEAFQVKLKEYLSK